MTALRLTLATLHLLALGLGFGAIHTRARTLRERLDMDAMRRIFRADAAWGIAAAIWIGTGVWRMLASMEKPAAYYMSNQFFFWKMGLLGLILLLEIRPMITLIKWRRAAAKGTLDLKEIGPTAKMISLVSSIQSVLVVLMVALAVAMARGFGAL
jgi:putative membrane protein